MVWLVPNSLQSKVPSSFKKVAGEDLQLERERNRVLEEKEEHISGARHVAARGRKFNLSTSGPILRQRRSNGRSW